ncbi:MAG: hypothetical protein MR860_01035, partial [Prevotella sp.]|nr:hypothetical protein [Prevotella sp.]
VIVGTNAKASIIVIVFIVWFSYMPHRLSDQAEKINKVVISWYTYTKKTWSLYQLLAPLSEAVGIAHYCQNEQPKTPTPI